MAPKELADFITENQTETRRGFLSAIIYTLGALISLALAAPAALYLLIPPRSRKESGWVDAGDLGQFQPGQPQELTFRHIRVDGWKMRSEKATAWVAKLSNNQVVGFSPWYTHLGCAYHWDNAKRDFGCACHSAVCAIHVQVVSGPALRPLDRSAGRLEGR